MSITIFYIVFSFLGLALILLSLFFARLIYLKCKKETISIDKLKLQYITKLMPWIYAQIRRSVEVNVNTIIDSTKDNQNKLVSQDEYINLTSRIKTHFYGTIPISLSNTMFKYVSQKQIDILLLNAFNQYNNGFIKISNNG